MYLKTARSIVRLCSKYYSSLHKGFLLLENVIVYRSIAMELLMVARLIYFLALMIVANAERDTMKKLQDEITQNGEIPRVKIQVFRNPSEESNGTQFTVWGFWIKQPAEVDLSR